MIQLENLSTYSLTLICTLFTWGVTVLGASVVFFFKTIRLTVLNLMLGFGAGVMIAASFWSLLAPAIEICGSSGGLSWPIPCLGLIAGGGFILFADYLIQKLGPFSENGKHSKLKRSVLLVTAVTLHNIPEGMVIGVAFASAALIPDGGIWGGVVLAIGIGLQNFPEGAAVSLPLRRDGVSRSKSFLYGQLSGMVEPIAGFIGVAAVKSMTGMVPFLMAFSAGAMIAVVIGELIPESVRGGKVVTIVGFLLGFTVMMILDVTLG